ncbi:hypothetical protein AGLY_010451 [Aphis glycines]|uniref:Origin recognition complex subunit 1 n=1 Tax=Aphis glycines TaxID=307491 RepID=A0A6G0TDS6_APHGL|nr:hypothetical protein AGLY_010451 [Aphis glycines]
MMHTSNLFYFRNICSMNCKKHLRQSVTPRSGSKARRSILQDIPENKEIEISTPKTPRKTPKTHVKNLTASVGKRLNGGARIPCSALKKARANLHLHAAPKHLPCREFEYKSIHSFFVDRSMYISGVPGIGKTATVKSVIDSLNADLLMKHSFKFVEINGFKACQSTSGIFCHGKTSSSRAQTLLNGYFSNKKVKELSTILLVDEVDHICNRKQNVVYNILDWPSQTGSKVVVITITNTIDLPERVLRRCVTSRMGLTRLVFKPYTFQQLQEIIINMLIGNSTFDPDAVQLVARKVAAISGDTRRALDICRRATDLIKSEDDSQLITINHVSQVLNSILSDVRVFLSYGTIFSKISKNKKVKELSTILFIDEVMHFRKFVAYAIKEYVAQESFIRVDEVNADNITSFIDALNGSYIDLIKCIYFAICGQEAEDQSAVKPVKFFIISRQKISFVVIVEETPKSLISPEK